MENEAQHAENWYERHPEAVTEAVMLPIYGITAYKQTEKSKQTSQT